MKFNEMGIQLPPFRKTVIFKLKEVDDPVSGYLITNRDLDDAGDDYCGELDGLSVVCDNGVYNPMNFTHWAKIPKMRGPRKQNETREKHP